MILPFQGVVIMPTSLLLQRLNKYKRKLDADPIADIKHHSRSLTSAAVCNTPALDRTGTCDCMMFRASGAEAYGGEQR